MHPFNKSILCNPLIVQVTKDFIFLFLALFPFSLSLLRNDFIFCFPFHFSHLIQFNYPFYGTSLFSSILSHTPTMRVCGVGEGMSLFYIHKAKVLEFVIQHLFKSYFFYKFLSHMDLILLSRLQFFARTNRTNAVLIRLLPFLYHNLIQTNTRHHLFL